MAFSVVENVGGSVDQCAWFPIANNSGQTMYVGQLVTHLTTDGGVIPMPVASGAYDTTNKNIPFGVVIGTNLKNNLYSSTLQQEKIPYVSPLASATDYVLAGGPMASNDRMPMVKVQLIGPHSILRAPIYNSSLGTAPTVVTCTTGNANGAQGTFGAVDVAGVAGLATIYFRSGNNAGQYRVTSDTSTTALTWYIPCFSAVAVGDKAVRINGLRVGGLSRMYIDSTAEFVDESAALTSNYFGVEVVRLDLSVAGQEYVDFKFNASHFAVRA